MKLHINESERTEFKDYELTYAHSLVGDQIIDLFDSACEATDLSYRDEVLSGTGTVYFYDIDDYTEDNLLYSIDISDLRDTLAYIWKSCDGDEIDVENKIIDWLEDTVK